MAQKEATTAVAPYRSFLAKVTDMFSGDIQNIMAENRLEMTQYQKQIVVSGIQAINELLVNQGLKINDKEIDVSNITGILKQLAALQLNPVADPAEVYFSIRNVNRAAKGQKPEWFKTVEMGVEGDGNDALLARFGRDIKEIHPFWAVREQDKFSYPKHKGLETLPPEWEETGQGKFVRVIYPITFDDDQTRYFIGEREDVKRNLLAHVSQNLMHDKDIKDKFMNKVKDLSLDEILDDASLVQMGKISPAWSSPQSRESMILRKMRNNVVRKIPKDFSNGFVAMTYQESTDDSYNRMRRDVTAQANQEEFTPDEPKQPVKLSQKHDDVPVGKPDEKANNKPAEPEQQEKAEETLASQPAADNTPQDKDEAPW
ncbi:hypothetical protein [Schleiferilactobacillus harbinensis]|uniref:Uncharacterized protein n=1 Tax=Schleiferilactobacillus harbinensis TaxID=304207 RepID=A0A5P8M6L9_9LACO|nr:hypothetical protein [Schleiferilactobacillus harbinensis]QFR24109.1 hypothetical protein D1010_12335 [Schleiferilactobacillus harbinensis]